MPASPRRFAWILSAAGIVALVGACSLFEPRSKVEYVLLRANGQSLPSLAESTFIRHYTDGIHYDLHLFVRKISAGTVVLAGGNRFELSTTMDRTIDGVSSLDFPPVIDADDGYYTESGADLRLFGREFAYFKGRLENNGATLILTDDNGAYNFTVFEFARRDSL